jgi:plasmid stabilization system protein ParE
MIQVEWDVNALSRHEEWAFSIAVEYTIKHAQSYLNDIQNAITNISNHPLAGTDYPSPVSKNLKRLVTGNGYSIFYELDSVVSPTRAKIISVVRGQE